MFVILLTKGRSNKKGKSLLDKRSAQLLRTIFFQLWLQLLQKNLEVLVIKTCHAQQTGKSLYVGKWKVENDRKCVHFWLAVAVLLLKLRSWKFEQSGAVSKVRKLSKEHCDLSQQQPYRWLKSKQSIKMEVCTNKACRNVRAKTWKKHMLQHVGSVAAPRKPLTGIAEQQTEEHFPCPKTDSFSEMW